MLKTANDLFDRIVNCQPSPAIPRSRQPQQHVPPCTQRNLVRERFKTMTLYGRCCAVSYCGDREMANRTIRPTGYSGLVAGATLCFAAMPMAGQLAPGPLTDLTSYHIVQHLGADALLDYHMGSQELRPLPDHTNFPARAWGIDHCVRKRCVLSSCTLLCSSANRRF